MKNSCDRHVSIMYILCISHVYLMYISLKTHVSLMYYLCNTHVSLMYISCKNKVIELFEYKKYTFKIHWILIIKKHEKCITSLVLKNKLHKKYMRYTWESSWENTWENTWEIHEKYMHICIYIRHTLKIHEKYIVLLKRRVMYFSCMFFWSTKVKIHEKYVKTTWEIHDFKKYMKNTWDTNKAHTWEIH